MGNAAKLRSVLSAQRKKTAAARLQSLFRKEATSSKQVLLSYLVKLADDGYKTLTPTPPSKLTVNYQQPQVPQAPKAPTPAPKQNAQPVYDHQRIGTHNAYNIKPPATANTPGAVRLKDPRMPSASPVYIRPEQAPPPGMVPAGPPTDVNQAEAAYRNWLGNVSPAPPVDTRTGKVVPGSRPRQFERRPEYGAPSPLIDPRTGAVYSNLAEQAKLQSIPQSPFGFSPDELTLQRAGGAISPQTEAAANQIPGAFDRAGTIISSPFRGLYNHATNTLFSGNTELNKATQDVNNALGYNLLGALGGFNPAASIEAQRAAQQSAASPVGGTAASVEQQELGQNTFGSQTVGEALGNKANVIEDISPGSNLGQAYQVGDVLSGFVGPGLALKGMQGANLLTRGLKATPTGVLPFFGLDQNIDQNTTQSNQVTQAQRAGNEAGNAAFTEGLSRPGAGVQSVRSPVLGPDGKPVMNPDGTPQTEQSYSVNIPNPDGTNTAMNVPYNAARAAGLMPLFDQMQNGGAAPNINEIAQQSSSQLAKHPAAADMANSLNTTGKAPPGTGEQALKTLQQQGVPEPDANALSNWWGEPGNMATVLGLGATAVGLLMTFMGGQDGLMGWLMPALGIAGTVGGLGTLGYQGMFGEGVQNAVQGFAKPLMQQFGNMGYDSGLINQDQYWQSARSNLTPEQGAQVDQSFGAVDKNTPWYMRAYNSLAPESLQWKPTDAQIVSGMTPEQQAMYNQLSEKGKAEALLHVRGEKALPGSKPFQQPAEGPQVTTY
jgi:hypothetical protein